MTKNIQLGDEALDFNAVTTEGPISFHNWIGDSWCLFFSHPKDFTPVCTTELGQAAKMKGEFEKRNVKLIGLSADSLESHKEWIKDINETQNTIVNFPIVADEDRTISEMYGMIHPKALENFTVRSVFFIDPKKKVRFVITYPPSTGRNFAELLRAIDSVQLTEYHEVATPVDWNHGDECIISPKITDPDEIKQKFPKGCKEIKSYLRYTPQP